MNIFNELMGMFSVFVVTFKFLLMGFSCSNVRLLIFL